MTTLGRNLDPNTKRMAFRTADAIGVLWFTVGGCNTFRSLHYNAK